jgi:hypothetical protein
MQVSRIVRDSLKRLRLYAGVPEEPEDERLAA